jgi:hypothetical protein
MIHIIRQKATQEQVDEMLQEYSTIIKLAVDIQRKFVAGGGRMHADCENVLLKDGSHQEDVWGANWIPATQTVEFEALINIRPRQQNFSIMIQDSTIKQQIETITRQLLEGV